MHKVPVVHPFSSVGAHVFSSTGGTNQCMTDAKIIIIYTHRQANLTTRDAEKFSTQPASKNQYLNDKYQNDDFEKSIGPRTFQHTHTLLESLTYDQNSATTN